MNLMRDTEAETNGSRARARCSGAFRPVHISVYFLFTVIRGGGRFYIPVFRTRRLRRGSTEDGAHTSEPWIWFQSRFCPSVCQKVTSSLKKNSNTIIALNKDFGVSYKVSKKKKKPNKHNQQHPGFMAAFYVSASVGFSFCMCSHLILRTILLLFYRRKRHR